MIKIIFSYCILFFFIFLVNQTKLKGQQSINKTFEISSSVGIGFIESQKGFSYDGEISILNGRFGFGIYYNGMTSFTEIEALPNDNTNITFTETYFELLNNFYHRATNKSQNSIGLNIKYYVVDSKIFQISFGGGPNYNHYRSTDQIIDSSEPFVPLASYFQRRQSGFSYQLQNSITYKISENIGIGLKTRFMDFIDHNVSFMLSTSIQI